MINKNSVSKFAVGVVSVATLLSGFAFTANAATSASASTANLAKVISRSDTAITTRIDALNKLSMRIGQMKNVSTTEVSSISTGIQTQINNLTTLKSKIDADTDVATARADAKTITGDYRTYALTIPQASIVASSDRITTLVGMINAIQTKLQARITTAQTAGKDVTALNTALADMTAKLSDATSQGQTAQSGVASLVPDQGNATIAASNKSALLSARTNIKTATADLKAARQDIATITQGLKAMK
jgi:chromosome segregation ATPase